MNLRRTLTAAGVVAGLLVAAITIRPWQRDAKEPARVEASEEPSDEAYEPGQPRELTAAIAPLPPPAEATTPPALEARPPSHPSSDQRFLQQRENNLNAALRSAVRRGQGARVRELLADYRRLYPEDENRMQEGYAILADCLEKPGAEAIAAAQRFYDARRGSTLRRAIRRVCLEPASTRRSTATLPGTLR